MTIRTLIIVVPALFAISLGTLILPSLLPRPTPIGLYLLLIALAFQVRRPALPPDVLVRDKRFLSMMAFFSLQILLSFFSFGLERGTFSLPNKLVSAALILIFITVLSRLHRDELMAIVKGYILLASLMALSGFAAWFLINVGPFQPGSFPYDVTQATDGRVTRAIPFEYDAPYNLGLVLTRTSGWSFAGFHFFRATAWAHEPSSAAFFLTPALILLIADKGLFGRPWRLGLALIIAVFLLVAASIAGMLALLVLAAFWLITSVWKGHRKGLMFSFVFIGIVLALSFNSELWLRAKGVFVESNLLTSKLSLEGDNYRRVLEQLFWWLFPQTGVSFVRNSLLTLLVYWNILIALSAVSKGGRTATFGFILLYLWLHGGQGSWHIVAKQAFTVLWFYLTLLYLYGSHVKDARAANQERPSLERQEELRLRERG